MILFEHLDGELKQAAFGGDIGTLCADLCLEISLIYGAMYKKNEGAAEEFRKTFIMSFFDKDISSKVFSTEVYDALTDSGAYGIAEIGINAEELLRQLKELKDSED